MRDGEGVANICSRISFALVRIELVLFFYKKIILTEACILKGSKTLTDGLKEGCRMTINSHFNISLSYLQLKHNKWW